MRRAIFLPKRNGSVKLYSTFGVLKCSEMMLPEDKKALEDMGRRLRELREEQGLSLRTLAGKTRIDNSKIAKIEKGQVNITFMILLRLCGGLSIQPKMVFEKVEN